MSIDRSVQRRTLRGDVPGRQRGVHGRRMQLGDGLGSLRKQLYRLHRRVDVCGRGVRVRDCGADALWLAGKLHRYDLERGQLRQLWDSMHGEPDLHEQRLRGQRHRHGRRQ
jgi:hypothetical protein